MNSPSRGLEVVAEVVLVCRPLEEEEAAAEAGFLHLRVGVEEAGEVVVRRLLGAAGVGAALMIEVMEEEPAHLMVEVVAQACLVQVVREAREVQKVWEPGEWAGKKQGAVAAVVLVHSNQVTWVEDLEGVVVVLLEVVPLAAEEVPDP